MRFKMLGLIVLSLSAVNAGAQDYKPVNPPMAEPELGWFSGEKNGLSYSGEAAALEKAFHPEKAHYSCNRVDVYRESRTVRYVPNCQNFRSVLGTDYYSYFTDIEKKVDQPAQTYVRKVAVKKLNSSQFTCMKDQYDALPQIFPSSADAAMALRDELGVNKVVISLEDNQKKAKPDSKLEYGPDLSSKGVLKLRVALTSDGRCMSADRNQLALTIVGWRAMAEKSKQQKSGAPSVDSENASVKTCPAFDKPVAPAGGANAPGKKPVG